MEQTLADGPENPQMPTDDQAMASRIHRSLMCGMILEFGCPWVSYGVLHVNIRPIEVKSTPHGHLVETAVGSPYLERAE